MLEIVVGRRHGSGRLDAKAGLGESYQFLYVCPFPRQMLTVLTTQE
jgi:hypothetical protein